MPKVVVAGRVDRLFEQIEVETPEREPFEAARCKACGWIGVAQNMPDDLPAHECTGLRERREPSTMEPRSFKVKRALHRGP